MTDTKHQGGCHCGAVRYEVKDIDLDNTMTCNCSRCSKLGTILTFAPAESFQLLAGEDKLTDYQFNKKVIHHLFCNVCGIQSFSRGVGPNGEEMIAVNARCLDDIDPDTLAPGKYDGKSV